jgi:Gluconate 2-dehydrogenase subunit 3
VWSSVRPILRAIGTTIVPEAADLDDNGWLAVERVINDALAPRPPALQRQIRLFIHLIEWAPVPRYGKRFTRLAATRRTAVLTSLQNARLFALRRGLWGLRTLILMGYYGRPEAAREVGYRASPAGWEARR